MTDQSDVFSDLDRAMQGTVRFGDGSDVNIYGKATIFFGRHGEHKVLMGVYYIPPLKNSIISVGQLDEEGSRVLIKDSVLRIWDRECCLLARFQRSKNKMSQLELQVARRLLCRALHQNDDAWRWHLSGEDGSPGDGARATAD
jgi:hypothetical protein